MFLIANIIPTEVMASVVGLSVIEHIDKRSEWIECKGCIKVKYKYKTNG